ncbi:MurR/RpiR family transcriptional regulator [Mycoplasmopsis alligatoris]|uniref:SIS domain protein n=1 Tax=Mycoplasmopsis alligatoris A21JP2 TaxID=747682 RepID=D4XVR9_9BACT|nr:MurR/RpiR family transcriptional regulator [Mycoplasmopsis alligatoris]EFF41554.1 SIS domain protein [Mycoplasmopsis alligatoris A21JP2]
MKNYEYKLKTKDIALTQGEKNLMKYFHEYNGDYFEDTIVELAEKANVSTSTISRFVKKVSFDTYKDFSKYINNRMEEFKISKDKENLTLADQVPEIIQRYTEKLHESITKDSVLKVMEIARFLVSAKRIVVFGTGLKSSVASNMATELTNIGLFADLVTNFNNLISIVANCDADDVLMVYSNKVSSLEYKFISSFAKSRNVKIIVITSMNTTDFDNDADIILSYGSVYFFNKFVTTRHDIFADIFTSMIVLEILNTSSLCSVNYRRAQGARQRWRLYQRSKSKKVIEE